MLPMTPHLSIVKVNAKLVNSAAFLPVQCRYQLWLLLRPPTIVCCRKYMSSREGFASVGLRFVRKHVVNIHMELKIQRKNIIYDEAV